LSFGTNPDMDVIKSLAAFSCLDDLKALQPPSSPCFTEFKLYESPTHESLLNFIAPTTPFSNRIGSRKKRGKIWLERSIGSCARLKVEASHTSS